MRIGVRRRLQDEGGIGLVEMMMSILVIGLILTALASALITSLRAIAGNESQVQATAVHQEVLESIVALPWELIGIYGDDPGYQATVSQDGTDYDTVTLTHTGTPDPRVPVAQQTITRSNRAFTVDTDVYWVDTDGNGSDDAKRLRTTVTWSDRDQSRSSVFYALRTPTVEELPEPFELLLFEPSPNTVQLDVDDKTTAAVTFTIQFTGAATGVTLSYPTPSGSSSLTATVVDGAATKWTATLPALTTVVPGDQLIEVSGASVADTSQSAIAATTVTFIEYGAPPPPTDFEVHDITVSPNPVTAISGTQDACPFTVTVRVKNFVAGDVVNLTYTHWTPKNKGNSFNDASSSVVLDYVGADGVFGVFSKTLDPPDVYFLTNNNKQVTFLAEATPAWSTTTKSLSLTVNTAGVSACS